MRRALAFAALLLASAAPAAAASPPPVIEETIVAPPPDPVASLLRTQVGSWKCTVTYPGLRATEAFVVVWSYFGDHYIRGTADLAAFRREPLRKVDIVFGYDVATKRWSNVFADSSGAYAIAQSAPGPPGKSISFANVFPADSTLGSSLVVLGARKTTFDNAWTVARAQRASHEICAKIPI